MTYLDFYVSSIITGSVLGEGMDESPEKITRALGENHIDDIRKRMRRLDYGLFEFYFFFDDGVWIPEGINIQIHRLAHMSDTILIPNSIQSKYGPFPLFVRGQDLIQAVAERVGEETTWQEETVGDTTSFHPSNTRAYIHIVTHSSQLRGSKPGNGDVWSIELR